VGQAKQQGRLAFIPARRPLSKKKGNDMKTLRKLFYCLLMFGLLLAISSSASAQTVEKKSLTLDGAEQVIAAAKAEASQVKAPAGVIAVVDAGGNLMAL